MFPTRTDSDRKRLRRALAATAILYGLAALGVLLIPSVLPAHSAGASAYAVSRHPPVRLRLARMEPGKRQETEKQAETGESRYAQSMASAAAENAPEEDPFASVRPDGGSQPLPAEMSGGSGGTGDQGGTGAVSPEAFIAWLDRAIRERLLYPERARRRNLQGTVELLLNVKADGSVCGVQLVRGSGYAVLDRDAIDLVSSLFPAPVRPGTDFADIVRIEYVLEKK